jgi:ABC-type amino acid transport substrate-binding protein
LRKPNPYVGLILAGARTLAEREGRRLVDRSPNLRSRRASLLSNRVDVLLNQDGVVVKADVG